MPKEIKEQAYGENWGVASDGLIYPGVSSCMTLTLAVYSKRDHPLLAGVHIAQDSPGAHPELGEFVDVTEIAAIGYCNSMGTSLDTEGCAAGQKPHKIKADAAFLIGHIADWQSRFPTVLEAVQKWASARAKRLMRPIDLQAEMKPRRERYLQAQGLPLTKDALDVLYPGASNEEREKKYPDYKRKRAIYSGWGADIEFTQAGQILIVDNCVKTYAGAAHGLAGRWRV